MVEIPLSLLTKVNNIMQKTAEMTNKFKHPHRAYINEVAKELNSLLENSKRSKDEK